MSEIRTLAEIERQAILEAVVACHYHLARAAKRLGIGQTTIYRKMHEYGIPLKTGSIQKSLSFRKPSRPHIL
jgi:DNA-binding NtrC family response regulator